MVTYVVGFLPFIVTLLPWLFQMEDVLVWFGVYCYNLGLAIWGCRWGTVLLVFVVLFPLFFPLAALYCSLVLVGSKSESLGSRLVYYDVEQILNLHIFLRFWVVDWHHDVGYILKLRLFIFREGEGEGGKGGSDWLVKGIGFVDLKGEANYSKKHSMPQRRSRVHLVCGTVCYIKSRGVLIFIYLFFLSC